jgi:hypothetical protein
MKGAAMSAGSSQPFRHAGTAMLSASTTSANVALVGGGDSLLITNAAATLAFVRFGADSAVAATTSDIPLLPNSRTILAVNSLIRYAAAILSSGTGSVYFTRGDGAHI